MVRHFAQRWVHFVVARGRAHGRRRSVYGLAGALPLSPFWLRTPESRVVSLAQAAVHLAPNVVEIGCRQLAPGNSSSDFCPQVKLLGVQPRMSWRLRPFDIFGSARDLPCILPYCHFSRLFQFRSGHLSLFQLSLLSPPLVFMVISAARGPSRILVRYGSSLILELLIPIERRFMSRCARWPLAHIRSFVVKSLRRNEFGLLLRGLLDARVYADTFEVEHITLFVHGEAFAGLQCGRWTALLSSPWDCLGVGLDLREVA
jgi:hypothetical protein